MKVLFTAIFNLFFLASIVAAPFDEIKIGSNGKTSSLEIRFTSTHKKNKEATVSLINEKGNTVDSFKVSIIKGQNIIPLSTLLGLPEGLYTVNIMVGKKTLSTKLIIFE